MREWGSAATGMTLLSKLRRAAEAAAGFASAGSGVIPSPVVATLYGLYPSG
jgi:hypothetical protein